MLLVRSWIGLGAVLLGLSLIIVFSSSAQTPAEFGPETFVKDGPAPQRYVRTFELDSAASPCTLTVENGDQPATRVSKMALWLNNRPVVKLSELDPSIPSITKTVSLKTRNRLALMMLGKAGALVTVTIRCTADNTPPSADAGADQTVRVGETVVLDGSGSSDVDGDSLRFDWSFSSMPQGSGATLSDTTAVQPSFDVDLPGTYAADLVVNDGQVDSAPDTTLVSTENSPPVADTGPDQMVLVGETVTLDGSKSSDLDGDTLKYAWSLPGIPEGSIATLSASTDFMPTFIADLPGSYVAQLTVNDGTLDSPPDTVNIDARNSAPDATDLLPTPDPDPCKELGTSCRSAFVDPFLIISIMEVETVSTVVSDKDVEVLALEWVPNGDAIDLVVTFPNQEPLFYLQFVGSLPSLGTANLTAAALVGLNRSNAGNATISSTRDLVAGAQGSFNEAGCDWLHDPGVVPGIDCSDKGICCDLHDFCIDVDCRGENDSGNVLECWLREIDHRTCLSECTLEPGLCHVLCMDRSPPCSPVCETCHLDVVKCFISGATCPPHCPKPSACCSRGDCTQPQQCIRCEEGPFERCWVETDECECAKDGLPSVDPCNPHPPGGGGGQGWGDPHLVTFDRLAYDFQGVGEFVMTQSLNDSFEVQARMVPWPGSRVALPEFRESAKTCKNRIL